MRELQRTDLEVAIIWKAFELRPEPVPTLDPGGDYLTRAWKQSVYPLAERLGMTLRLPPVQPRSGRAHEAAHWARTQGRFEDYHTGLFRAFFERGEDIGQLTVLLRLASDLALDERALREALETRKYVASVFQDEKEGADLGVHGVPAFVADRRVGLSGVQTLGVLQEMVTRARSLRE